MTYKEFRDWIGTTGDFFDSIQNSYGNSLSVSEKAILGKALGNLKLITLDLPEYYAAYKDGGWTEFAQAVVENVGTGLVVAGVAAGTAALVPGAAGILAGVATGMLAGAAIGYGLDALKDNELLNRVANESIDYAKSFLDGSDGNWEPGVTRLEEIEVIGYPKLSYDVAIENLKTILAEFDLAISDLMSIDDISEGGSFLGAIGESSAVSGYKNLSKVEVAVSKVLKAYEENKKEIDKENPLIEERIEKLVEGIRLAGVAVNKQSPLVLDLDGDGVETIGLSSTSKKFDFKLDGTESDHGWISSDDGFLAIDKNDNGAIDNSGELFGSSDIDGFSSLAKLDTNDDGVISSSDNLFDKLLVWRDINYDAQSDQSELASLEQLDISSINLRPELVDRYDGLNWIPLVTNYTKINGLSYEVADVYFVLDRPEDADAIVTDPDAYVVIGTMKDDHIISSEKNQGLVGGAGSDIFYFAEHSGRDVILDFKYGNDKINLVAWHLTDVDQLEISSSNEGTLLEHGLNSIILKKIDELDIKDILI